MPFLRARFARSGDVKREAERGVQPGLQNCSGCSLGFRGVLRNSSVKLVRARARNWDGCYLANGPRSIENNSRLDFKAGLW